MQYFLPIIGPYCSKYVILLVFFEQNQVLGSLEIPNKKTKKIIQQRKDYVFDTIFLKREQTISATQELSGHHIFPCIFDYSWAIL
jgi:hypothetical protein